MKVSNKIICRRALAWCVVLCCATAHAAIAADDNKNLDILTYGGVRYEFFHIINSTVPPKSEYIGQKGRLTGMPLHAIDCNLGLYAKLHERYTAKVGVRSRLYADIQEANIPLKQTLKAGLEEAHLDFLFGNLEKPPVSATLGYFKYRYAPEVYNLGEYLMSGGTYPGFVYSGSNGWNILGLLVRGQFMKYFTHDLLFTAETFVKPNFDLSLSYIALFAPSDIVKINAGVVFARLIPSKESETTPTKNPPKYDPETRDSVYLTHAGIKLMARFVLDPKPLFGPTRLGKEDLKLYAEAAVLGVKNYPVLYEEISERIPVMVGIHLPAFGLLDVLAAEFEWYGSPHENTPINNGLPEPWISGLNPGHKNDIKWSIGGSRMILNGFSIAFKVASDHLRLEDGTGWYQAPEERINAPDEWYYNISIGFNF